jgi:hypothetical protein
VCDCDVFEVIFWTVENGGEEEMVGCDSFTFNEGLNADIYIDSSNPKSLFRPLRLNIVLN